MQRRTFLQAAGILGVGSLIAGGYCVQTASARSLLRRQLLQDSESLLTQSQLSTMQSLPQQAAEELKTWFHAPCLNAHTFAEQVCTQEFRGRLTHCADDEERRWLFLTVFLQQVVSETEILEQVRGMSQQLGKELDRDWQLVCTEISQKWQVHLGHSGSRLPNNLAEHLQQEIQTHLKQCLIIADVNSRRSLLGETLQDVTATGLHMVPAMVHSPCAVLPVFLVNAVTSLYSHLIGFWSAPQEQIRQAIASRLVTLADHIGQEFQSETQASITQFHAWQQEALRRTAQRQVDQAIRWIST